MNQIDKLKQYCQDMFLDFEIEDDVLSLDHKLYRIIEDENRQLFDEEMNFLPISKLEEGEVGYAYEFGGRWYIQISGEDVTLTELKYIGNAKQVIPTKSFLGIRSGYELMNGMGLYSEWIKKAKFLGIEALGICERNTLSGALAFQQECERNDIKSIIGLTISIKGKSNSYDIKIYAKDFQGWINMLKFNEMINVLKEHSIEEDFLIKHREGLFLIADPKSMIFQESSQEILQSVDFYQLDTVVFLNEDVDKAYVNNLEKFILSELKPINIVDAFYLEKQDYVTREIMWSVAKSFDQKTNNQYFKNCDQFAMELISMFERDNKSWVPIFKLGQQNLNTMTELCNFKYDTDTRHLPKYKMSQNEASKFKTNEDLFLDLVLRGLSKKGLQNEREYIERLKAEIKVLTAGDVIDYFLVLHDIIQYAKSQGMLTGIGRGSAGGSLVAYLLEIIQIDPLEFDLLFERFLNLGRMGKWEDRPFYTFVDEKGSEIGLAEGSLVRVLRDNKERIVFVHEIKEGDEIIKY